MRFSSPRWRFRNGAYAPTLALLLAAAVIMTACERAPAGLKSGGRPSGAASPDAPAPLQKPVPHVFLIVMENRSLDRALAMPYVSQLAARSAVATDYHAVARPSLPNYLALTSGSTWNITDNGYHPLPAGGIGSQLTAHGLPWRAYMEGMTGSCLSDGGRYAVKHNPFAYYGGGCPGNVVPLTALDADLASGEPVFSWITPDLCHDGHDCGAQQSDDFLRRLVPRILDSPGWRQDGLLLITWDEDDGSAGNRVLTLAVGPRLTARRTDRRYDHYSLLAAVEDRLGLSRLGNAAQANPLTELLG